MIGGYIRIYGLESIIKYKSEKRLLMITTVSLVAFVLLVDLLSKYSGIKEIMQILEFYNGMSNLLVICIAIALFMVFHKCHFYSKQINKVSASTFGIYLLHNSGVVQIFLWQKWWPNIEYVSSGLFLFHLLTKTLTVFAGCLIIDILRITFVERPLRKISYFLQRTYGRKE